VPLVETLSNSILYLAGGEFKNPFLYFITNTKRLLILIAITFRAHL